MRNWLIAAAVLGLIGLGAHVAGLGVVQLTSHGDAVSIRQAASRYNVNVRRDAFGVPHIRGPRDADVAFGLGYAHAEDDFQTMSDVVLAVRGRAAETHGRDAAIGDYLVQLLRVWPTVDQKYESDLPADVRAVLEAYATGVNLYAVEHPDATPPALLPVTGRDIAAGFVFRTPFFYGFDGVLRDLQRGPAPKAPGKQPGKAGEPKGSNGVAVAPQRSSDGATRLLVNSHQPYTGPVAWWEAVLESGEGWHVAGGFFPGAPFMLHGHNAALGWANTVNKPDLVDIYRLVTDAQHKGMYRLDGEWRPFDRHTAKIAVRIWGPFTWTVKREVLWTVHGPVFDTPRGPVAIRYAGMGGVRAPLQYFRLNKARDLAEWKAAMALQALPSINYIYADARGNIGYVYNGLFPLRKPGADWSGELPGDRSDLVWTQVAPFAQTPQVWNPKGGLVFNSNNTPFVATAPEEGILRSSVPATFGVQENMTNRAWRALETYGADRSITREEFEAYKYDVTYSARSVMAARVQDLLALDPAGNADMAAAQGILKAWDLRADAQSRGAALAVLTVAPIEFAIDEGRTPPDLRKSFEDAIARLKTHYGRLDPPWGEVNRLRRGTVDLPLDGGPDTFRAVYGAPEGDGALKGVAGDTLIMFVEWDKAGRLTSRSVHQFGAATLDARSPHYADQAPLFARMQTKPVLFTEEELAGHIREDYRPGERKTATPRP